MADERICPKCGMPPVPGCDGRGHIPVDDMTMKLCRNLYAKALRQHLGKDLSRVQHVPSSPLLKRASDGTFVVDRTKDNLHIKGCTWSRLLPHLKLALGCKGLNFHFKILTDQQIKNVFVGNEHRQFRKPGQEFYNSLGDLVGEFDLVIIKLGYIGHKNVAAPGALKETLLIREASSLPTWVVEDPYRPWTHSCDPDVEYYIQDRFDVVTIKGADPGCTVDDEPDDMGVDPDPEKEFMPDIREASAEPSLDLPGERGQQESQHDGGSGGIELPGETQQQKRWRR